MTPRSAKAKGRRFEMEVAAAIRAAFNLPERDVQPTPMGCTGTDVKLSERAHEAFPYAVECKCVERINLWEAWRQCAGNTKEGEHPLLFTRKNNSETLVVLRMEHLFELIKEAKDGNGN